MSFVLGVGGVAVASAPDRAYHEWETWCVIRHDKFDYVLPGAMRRNGIDMWIIIDKGRGTEPLSQDFGESTSNGNGIYVFTDRGGDRIERAVLGREESPERDCGVYDIHGSPTQLKEIVVARKPRRIGVNYTTADELYPPEGRHIADGLSHTDYENLKRTLGEPYASRLVSAERLIADFRSQHVGSEIVEFTKVADATRMLEESALSKEVVSPGKTTLLDVAWWLEEQSHILGFEQGWFPSVYVSPPDGVEINDTGRVIQPGDVIQIDWGIGRNNFFTDIKRFSYVLRPGETDVPVGIRHAFEVARKVRDIIQHNVRSGETGREQLDRLKRRIREAGYVYTEEEHASGIPGIEVNIGMHAVGNFDHDVGAALFELYPVRTTYEVRPNSLISVEFIGFIPAQEWNGHKVPVDIEENALITDHGIEWLYPPQDRILVIH